MLLKELFFSKVILILRKVQEERILHQQVKCIITEEKVCGVCKKKIGNRYVKLLLGNEKKLLPNLFLQIVEF